jgi:hypothetical protein
MLSLSFVSFHTHYGFFITGFEPYAPPAFSGEAVLLSDPVQGTRIQDKLDSVVKYGVTTGLTIGNLYHSGVHVRFIDHDLKLPDSARTAIMCDQIEIQNFPQGQFFKCGDSGSFVFCINPDKTLSCLGMAIGLTSHKTCLVTPITRILDSLCRGASLRPCSSSGISTQHSDSGSAVSQQTLQSMLGDMMVKMQTRFQTSLQDVQRNFETSLQTSLQNVERNVESAQASLQTNFQVSLQSVERNFQASLQRTERNFQSAIQSMQTGVQKPQTHIQQSEDSRSQPLSDQSSNN